MFDFGRSLNDRRTFAPIVLAVSTGAALWFAAAIASGKQEAWDGTAYWALAYPAAIAACAYLGYSYPDRSWRWALLLFQAQFIAMCILNGEIGNLWPLGIALLAVIALPGVLASKLAARARRRTEARL